ncbi:uncharacterized protein LOC118478236 [Aplysia californica]|uniref:Uncharacterized protein LOC118478236 n=1 Tax=Aplysia californica TaxID=6500 RepID=A0ABM1VY11_APLCA|nr:uncharacterized protein LOC118478236 [Aplysia californica]
MPGIKNSVTPDLNMAITHSPKSTTGIPASDTGVHTIEMSATHGLAGHNHAPPTSEQTTNRSPITAVTDAQGVTIDVPIRRCALRPIHEPVRAPISNIESNGSPCTPYGSSRKLPKISTDPSSNHNPSPSPLTLDLTDRQGFVDSQTNHNAIESPPYNSKAFPLIDSANSHSDFGAKYDSSNNNGSAISILSTFKLGPGVHVTPPPPLLRLSPTERSPDQTSKRQKLRFKDKEDVGNIFTRSLDTGSRSNDNGEFKTVSFVSPKASLASTDLHINSMSSINSSRQHSALKLNSSSQLFPETGKVMLASELSEEDRRANAQSAHSPLSPNDYSSDSNVTILAGVCRCANLSTARGRRNHALMIMLVSVIPVIALLIQNSIDVYDHNEELNLHRGVKNQILFRKLLGMIKAAQDGYKSRTIIIVQA